MMRESFQQGVRYARERLGWPWTGVATASALGAVLGFGVLQALRVQSASGAQRVASDLLQGASFGLVLPLFVFALGGRVDAGRDALLRILWVRHGGPRRPFALGTLSWIGGAGGVLAVLCVVLSLGLAHASVARDVAAMDLGPNGGALAAGCLLAAGSYTAALGLAQLLGGAVGRAVFLLGDWLLGSGAGAAALPWPRAHVRALLGGTPVLELSRASSGTWLLTLTLVCLLVYVRRVPP